MDTWGSYSLTLIDALDTLAVMGNYSEFSRVYHLLAERWADGVHIVIVSAGGKCKLCMPVMMESVHSMYVNKLA